jgi:methanogenic corrinoid protein MtbC1
MTGVDTLPINTPVLSVAGLQRFNVLRDAAIDAVTERFYSAHGGAYAQFGPRGREACREDIGYHLEFLRPVLEFGLTQPLLDYLRWLRCVFAARDVPAEHLPLSLDWLAEFFAASLDASDAGIVVTALHKARARFLEADSSPAAIDGFLPAPWPECESFEAALLAGDRQAAGSILGRCLDAGHSLIDAEQHMIQPALYGIGEKWQNNQVTIAQEHLATAIAQWVMTLGVARSAFPVPNGKKVLLACVDGNKHSVGLQMVADAFQFAGWEVHTLGANVPTSELLGHVDQLKPDLLGLSVSFAQQLHVVRDIMAQLEQAYGPARPAVIIGGLAINQFNGLAKMLSTDGWSPDASSAVTFAATLGAHKGAT